MTSSTDSEAWRAPKKEVIKLSDIVSKSKVERTREKVYEVDGMWKNKASIQGN